MVHLLPLYKQKIKREKPQSKTVKIYSKEAVEALNACYDCTNWEVFIESSETLDEATEVISDYVNFCNDLVVPSKQVKIYPNSKPWESKELKELIHERQSAIKDNNDEEAKTIQKKIDKCIKIGKKNYKDKLESNFSEGKAKESWQNLATITGYKKKSGEIRTNDDQKFANDLNEFYTRFDKHDYSEEQRVEISKVIDKLDDPINVTEEEIRTLFKKLNAKSASGPDNIPSKVLKLCSDSLAYVFTALIQ